MMKYALVLVLLQIGICFQLNMNLNVEIINHLKALEPNSSLLIQQNVSVPGTYMNTHPSRCVSTFSRELKNTLNNITHNFTTADAKYKIQLLQANLRELGKGQVNDNNCTMTMIRTQLNHRKSSPWIKKYILFLRKLNNSG